METLLIIDKKDYNEHSDMILRVGVRGIIEQNGRFLFIQDKMGGLKLPGGGQEEGESDIQTLAREITEETGFDLVRESVRPFGIIEERRKAKEHGKIWCQVSRVYFCSINGKQTAVEMTESEIQNGLHLKKYTIDKAIEKNSMLLGTENELPWHHREYETFLCLKKHLQEQRNT